MLATLGPVFPLSDEAQFTTAAAFGAFSGASFGWMAHIIGWFLAQGLPEDTARALIAATLRGNAEVLLREDRPLDEIAASVVTPGGISEMVLKSLFRSDGMTAWDEGLDAVLQRIRG
jgi:pyrroline-5-carboxylate reductase